MLYTNIWSRCATEGANDSIWGPGILRPDRTVIYQAKRTEFRTHDGSQYNVVFLTHSMRLYNDKILSDKAITSMRNILSQTKHLQEEHQKGSKSFEVVLGFLKSEEYNVNHLVIFSYIFNVETEIFSWPGSGIDIWSDPVIGDVGFRADRLADIGM